MSRDNYLFRGAVPVLSCVLRVLAHSNKLITFNHKNADSMAAIIAQVQCLQSLHVRYLISCGCAHVHCTTILTTWCSCNQIIAS